MTDEAGMTGGTERGAAATHERVMCDDFRVRFAHVHDLGMRALEQVDDGQVQAKPSAGCNSPAVIVKHVAGNFRSRFTDFLASDGEKPWRDRDGEFSPDGARANETRARWRDGWSVLFAALDALNDEDLRRTVYIRGEAHSVRLALLRALDHAAYHIGQLVTASKLAVGEEAWLTLTISPGGSRRHNVELGFDPERPDAAR